VAALVVRDRVVPEPDKPRRDQVPDVRGGGEPMDQEDGVVATRPLADVEPHAVGPNLL
jgi:hypothetical protein